mmetsp:Transcript_5760/g.18268  ORF Transcript_5760/g.18268 Transcript_5760/m.18268 type:complete len:218 (+) Transcript_5760:83-736(+)
MPLRLRGNDAAHPFVTSDLWRGFLTSCHQTDVHVEREYRYYPVELTIDAVVGTKVTATFVTHADHSFYELKGEYEEATRRLYLTPVRGVVGRRWEPCDAEVYISHDGTTLSGNSICDQHGECDDGGGEFVLRHDRTQLVVEGAGLAGVNGIYTSQRSVIAAPGNRAGLAQGPLRRIPGTRRTFPRWRRRRKRSRTDGSTTGRPFTSRPARASARSTP